MKYEGIISDPPPLPRVTPTLNGHSPHKKAEFQNPPPNGDFISLSPLPNFRGELRYIFWKEHLPETAGQEEMNEVTQTHDLKQTNKQVT